MIEFTLQPVVDGEHVETVRMLFREYEQGIATDLECQGFAAELAGLPSPYQHPAGALLVAYTDGDVSGCVGLRTLDSQIGEMKRLYVRPAYRGSGLAGTCGTRFYALKLSA
ncbi:GNAT family N-acetyltransferase [Lysobacter terrae]